LTGTCDEHALRHSQRAVSEEPEPRYHIQDRERGWLVYDPDLDRFVESEAPKRDE
jgi:hypothetical protein